MDKETQVSWGGRFSGPVDELMVRFSESVSFDSRLALYDIDGSLGHARMLLGVGILSEEEFEAINAGLEAIKEEIVSGRFAWKVELEDVHMNIEQALTTRVPAAAKLHTGRSRNDQIATDMRLFFKDACARLEEKLEKVMVALVSLGEANLDILIPGYTHLQRAQPVYAAHHLLAYVEMLARDRTRFARVGEDANVSPLGSGALAGSTLPLDREAVAGHLGFTDARGRPLVTANSMDAIADRDLYLDFLHACALVGVHLSRMAEDFILWGSQEFGFIQMPDAFCTGSSLMPQKKNPDVWELVRGKSARLQGNLQTLFTLLKGQPLTYNRDLQEDKPPVFDSFDQLAAMLELLPLLLLGTSFRQDRCAAAVADPLLLATDLADYLVVRGVAFREAHHAVGALVKRAEETGRPINHLSYEEVRAVNPSFGEDWAKVFSLRRAMDCRKGTGMPGAAQVNKQIRRWKKELG